MLIIFYTSSQICSLSDLIKTRCSQKKLKKNLTTSAKLLHKNTKLLRYIFFLSNCMVDSLNSAEAWKGCELLLFFLSLFLSLFLWKSPFSALLKESTLSTCEFLSNNMMEPIFNPPSSRMSSHTTKHKGHPPTPTPQKRSTCVGYVMCLCVSVCVFVYGRHIYLTRQQTQLQQVMQKDLPHVLTHFSFSFRSYFCVEIVCIMMGFEFMETIFRVACMIMKQKTEQLHQLTFSETSG